MCILIKILLVEYSTRKNVKSCRLTHPKNFRKKFISTFMCKSIKLR